MSGRNRLGQESDNYERGKNMGGNSVVLGIGIGSHAIDGVLIKDGDILSAKDFITTDDLLAHIENCLNRLADGADYASGSEMLKQANVMNYTSVIADSIVRSGKGPRVGVIATKGFEKTLYGPSGCVLPTERFVPKELIVGLAEEVDTTGKVIKDIDRDEVYALAKYLMERGAQTVAICLKNSYCNPVNEQAVMTIIDKEISKHYLGGVVTLCSHEVSTSRDDFVRLCTTVLNQYVSRDSSKFLKLVESHIKDVGLAARLRGCSSAMGGVKRIAKARAIDTFASTDVANLNGALFMMDKVGNENVIVVDIGGATTSMGIIKDGAFEFDVKPLIYELPIDLPRPALKILNIGGYSVASINDKGSVVVGPVSIDPDGTEPTVTDAKIVLGFDLATTDHNRNVEQAGTVVDEIISRKLKISKEEAALKIIDAFEMQISAAIRMMLSAKGYDAKKFDLYVVGGAGASHICSLAKRVGAKRAVIFPFGSVFSAFGVTSMDIVYEYRTPVSKKDELDKVVTVLKTAAEKDLKYEGVSEKDLTYIIGFVVKDGSGSEKIVQPGTTNLQKEAEKISAAKQEITAVMLKVSASPHKVELQKQKEKKAAAPAKNGKRGVCFSGRSQQVDVYSYQNLNVGNTVAGPAVVELAGSSLILPKGCELSIDAYQNGIIQQKA